MFNDYRTRDVLIGFQAFFMIFLSLHFLFTGSKEALYFLLVLVVSSGIWKILKQFAIRFFPTQSLRPVGANDCHSFVGSGSASQTGMPSGHATGAALMAVYAINFVWNHSSVSNVFQKTVATGVAMMLAMLIIISRVKYNCHTRSQVSVGALLGIALGLIGIECRRFVL